MTKFKNNFFKYKLCLRILKGEKLKDICNELVDNKILPENMRYKGIDKHSSFNILYNFYKSFQKFGIYCILNERGKRESMPKKGSTKKEWEEKRKQKKKEILDKLTKEQLLDLVEFWEELATEKYSKYEIQKRIIEKKKKNFSSISINDLCILSGLSKTYFYKLNKIEIVRKDKRFRSDEILIKKIIQKIYFEHQKTFGARRIHITLRKTPYNFVISYKTVKKYMCELNLKAIIRKKNKRRVDYKNTRFNVDNLLNRNFQNTPSNNSICTDITFIPWRGIYIYLSIVIDLRNNEIIAWHISLSNDLELVKQTFKDIDLNKYLYVHSDHGIQYTSNWFANLISNSKAIQSMSRIGNSLDNRPAEYFFSIIKEELIKLNKIDDLEFDEIYKLIFNFISYYNNDRIQSSLGWLTPNQYKELYLD